MPFETTVLGVPVTVNRVDLGIDGQIVAVCSYGRNRQQLPILDLPLPAPSPAGAEWIEAYRMWRLADSGRSALRASHLGRLGQRPCPFAICELCLMA